jgi:hypothetical protein
MSRTLAVVGTIVTLAACASAFLLGRASADHPPPSLPPAAGVTRTVPAIGPAIVLPPRAKLP